MTMPMTQADVVTSIKREFDSKLSVAIDGQATMLLDTETLVEFVHEVEERSRRMGQLPSIVIAFGARADSTKYAAIAASWHMREDVT
jgi:hypothetical protein